MSRKLLMKYMDRKSEHINPKKMIEKYYETGEDPSKFYEPCEYRGVCIISDCSDNVLEDDGHSICPRHRRELEYRFLSEIELSSSRPIDLSVNRVEPWIAEVLYLNFLKRGGIPGRLQLWGIRMIFGNCLIKEVYEYTSSFLFPLPHNYYLSTYQRYNIGVGSMDARNILLSSFIEDFNSRLPSMIEHPERHMTKITYPRMSMIGISTQRPMYKYGEYGCAVTRIYRIERDEFNRIVNSPEKILISRVERLFLSFFILSRIELIERAKKMFPNIITKEYQERENFPPPLRTSPVYSPSEF